MDRRHRDGVTAGGIGGMVDVWVDGGICADEIRAT
jgi:hypothetical protein